MHHELRELGLTSYEIKAYMTLLKTGMISANKLSKLSGVPQGKVYDTLYLLIDKGYIYSLNSRPKLFKAIKPKIAINQNIKYKRNHLDELEQKLPNYLETLQKTIPITPKTQDEVSVIWGRKNSKAPNRYLFETVKKSLNFIFTCESFLDRTNLRIMINKIKKGVKFKIIATTKKNKKLIREILNYKIPLKYYPLQELRLFIKDNSESMIQIVNPKDFHDRTSILVSSKELSKGHTQYFNTIWKKAEVIK